MLQFLYVYIFILYLYLSIISPGTRYGTSLFRQRQICCTFWRLSGDSKAIPAGGQTVQFAQESSQHQNLLQEILKEVIHILVILVFQHLPTHDDTI